MSRPRWRYRSHDAFINIIVMERIHYIIGFIIFLIFTCAAVGDEALTRSERIVALTILGEARGEEQMGMYAVACVIQERAIKRKLTPAQVCLQSKQFSIWNSIKKESDLHYLWKSKSTPYARLIARAVCDPEGYSPLAREWATNNANHYYSKSLKNKPAWAKGKKPIKIIGKHLFFKLP